MKILRNIFIVISTSLLVMFAIQMQDDRLKERSIRWPRNIFPADPIDEPYQIVKVGNSHSLDGINLKYVNLPALNAAGSGQRFEFDLAFLKQNRRRIAPNAIILIAVTPISFSHSNKNTLLGFQSGYYDQMSPIYIPNINLSDYIEGHLLWFSRVGYMMRKDHQKVVMDKVAAGEKWEEPVVVTPPTPKLVDVPSHVPTLIKKNIAYSKILENRINHPTNIKDHAESVNFMFKKWYHSDEFSPDYFPANREQLSELIDYSLQQGWRPILVTIPISRALQEGLLDDYYQVYLYDQLKQIDTRGIPYLDFTRDERIIGDDDFFGNSDHLGGEYGPDVFTYLLLQELEKIGYIDSSVNGYNTKMVEILVEN